MLCFIGYFVVAVATWAQVTGQYHTSPSEVPRLPTVNQTTTAVPLINVSTTLTNGHTASITTLSPTTMPATTETQSTKSMYTSGSSILARLTSIANSPTVPTWAGNQQVIVRQDFVTTTAAPPYVGPTPTYRQFDALSFAGGALLTISLVILGTYGWKMYMARIERSYWTL